MPLENCMGLMVLTSLVPADWMEGHLTHSQEPAGLMVLTPQYLKIGWRDT